MAPRSQLWIFLVILALWSGWVLLRPVGLVRTDGSLDTQRLFWVTLLSAVFVIGSICYWSR